jgi:CTP synthase (UTP-ammonia lyase)
MKYIVVSGSVVSGLGKGVTSSAIGALLRARGLRVTAMKIDPYLNVDAGKMSPFEHGEVYVLDDGGEVDLDLGSYERFLGNVQLTKDHNLTTGKIYSEVIQRERRGEFLGKTVQVVPHLVCAIQDWIVRVAHTPVALTPGTNLTQARPATTIAAAAQAQAPTSHDPPAGRPSAQAEQCTTPRSTAAAMMATAIATEWPTVAELTHADIIHAARSLLNDTGKLTEWLGADTRLLDELLLEAEFTTDEMKRWNEIAGWDLQPRHWELAIDRRCQAATEGKRDSNPCTPARDSNPCTPAQRSSCVSQGGDRTDVPEVCLVELGGSLGDIESMAFYEAVRQLKVRVGPQNLCHVHVTLVPTVGPDGGEHKTKPAQRALKDLRSHGIEADLLICRTMDRPLDPDAPGKIAAASGLAPERIVSICNTANIYHVPVVMSSFGVDAAVLRCLGLSATRPANLEAWRALSEHFSPKPHHTVASTVGFSHSRSDAAGNPARSAQHAAKSAGTDAAVGQSIIMPAVPTGTKAAENSASWPATDGVCAGRDYTSSKLPDRDPAGRPEAGHLTGVAGCGAEVGLSVGQGVVVIGIVGKYTKLTDAYLSLSRALQHAAFAAAAHVELRWIDSDSILENARVALQVHGLLVPGGFGSRGVDGMIAAIRYARDNKLPFLGICLGMQLAAVEFARHVADLRAAHSTEFDPTTRHPVVLPALPAAQTPVDGLLTDCPQPCHGPLAATLVDAQTTAQRKHINASTQTGEASSSQPTVDAVSAVGAQTGGAKTAQDTKDAHPHPLPLASTQTLGTKSAGSCLEESVGAMQLGGRFTEIATQTVAHQMYGATLVRERHRHRYHLNPLYEARLESAGMVLSGRDAQDKSVHTIELPKSAHPFFFAAQYHPEFLSRPFRPSPPFVAFVRAAATYRFNAH